MLYDDEPEYYDSPGLRFLTADIDVSLAAPGAGAGRACELRNLSGCGSGWAAQGFGLSAVGCLQYRGSDDARSGGTWLYMR